MILGLPEPGVLWDNIGADEARVNVVTVEEPLVLSHLAAYLDGNGPTAAGTQVLRGLVYVDEGPLIAVGDEVTVEKGDAPGWVQFRGLEGLELPPGDYRFGHISGPTTSIARQGRIASGTRISGYGDTYADGPTPVAPGPVIVAGTRSFIAHVFRPFAVPDVDDLTLSRLPFELTQRAFGSRNIVAGSRVAARAGFHGIRVDDEDGAVCIVRTGGPLEGLVGERLRITRRDRPDRQVFVYCHDEQEWPPGIDDEDLSVPRRAWLELAPWPVESAEVIVEVVA
jgi:hypothetical protein